MKRVMDAWLTEQLLLHPFYKEAKTIATYLSFSSQFQTARLIEEAQKRWEDYPHSQNLTHTGKWFVLYKPDNLRKILLNLNHRGELLSLSQISDWLDPCSWFSFQSFWLSNWLPGIWLLRPLEHSQATIVHFIHAVQDFHPDHDILSTIMKKEIFDRRYLCEASFSSWQPGFCTHVSNQWFQLHKARPPCINSELFIPSNQRPCHQQIWHIFSATFVHIGRALWSQYVVPLLQGRQVEQIFGSNSFLYLPSIRYDGKSLCLVFSLMLSLQVLQLLSTGCCPLLSFSVMPRAIPISNSLVNPLPLSHQPGKVATF